MLESSLVMGLVINIVVAAVILIVGLWLAKRLKNILSGIMVKRGVDPMLASFTGSIVHILISAFIVIAALGELGIQTTSLVAIMGAAGFAIGLALQGSLANFASGVMIIAFQPFKVGDYVEAGGTAGTIENIKIFSTQLTTGDNKSIIIPNANITGGMIINFSAKDTRRVDMVFGIGYDDDLKKAKHILQDIIANDERVLKDPAPLVAISELADSSVNFIVRPWVNSANYWDVYRDLTETVKLRLDSEGISIPYPQQDVHMHQAA